MTVMDKADMSKILDHPKTGVPYFFFSLEPHFHFKLAMIVHLLRLLSTDTRTCPWYGRDGQ